MEKLAKLPFVAWALKHKRFIAIVVILLTFILLGLYVSRHPDSIRRVVQTPPDVLLALFVLYCGVVATNAVITYATVRLCRHELSVKNSAFLTVYSTIVNFFGPLQSGPGVRAVYLKTKIGLKIRDYTLATFFYFIAFAALNVSFLFVNTLPYLTVIGILASIALIAFGVKRFHFTDRSQYVFAIFLVTLVQIILMAIIYFVELNVTKTPVNFTQALAYGASANLSLFVSVTPGAIGIREAFILFATSLHHVPLASVVAAGILDRAFYVVFLVVLFVASTALHVKESLGSKKLS
jgi:uncharacterized membrane protein YbhN (UPF0104 family)